MKARQKARTNNKRFSEEDFKKWRNNRFTKFFFECVEEDIKNLKTAILNLCLRNGEHTTIQNKSGELLSLLKLKSTEFDHNLGLYQSNDIENDNWN